MKPIHLSLILLGLAGLISLIVLNTPQLFWPDGQINEIYILSRNLLIISMINWLALLGIRLVPKPD